MVVRGAHCGLSASVNILGKYDNPVEKIYALCLSRDRILPADVRVAPIITEQTAKLGRFANYLQKPVPRVGRATAFVPFCPRQKGLLCPKHRLSL